MTDGRLFLRAHRDLEIDPGTRAPLFEEFARSSGLAVEEVAKATSRNAQDLFGI